MSEDDVQRLVKSRRLRPDRGNYLCSEPPKQAEEANRLVALRCYLGYPFGNCLEDTFEPLRLNPAENMLPEKEIPNSPNGLGRFGIVDYLLQKFVARRRHRA